MTKLVVAYTAHKDDLFNYAISNTQSLKLKLLFPLLGRVRLKAIMYNEDKQTDLIDLYLIDKSIIFIMTKKL